METDQQPRWVTWAQGRTYRAARTGKPLTYAQIDAGALPTLCADSPQELAMMIGEQDCLMDELARRCA